MTHRAQRIRANSLRSELAGVLVDEASSTLDLVGFEGLPAIDYATNGTFAVVILDPQSENGDSEIAYVDQHTAGSATVTLTRGVEGSTRREHPAGTKVIVGPTANDFGSPNQSARDDNSALNFLGSIVLGGGMIWNGPSFDSGTGATVVGSGAQGASYSTVIGEGAAAYDDEGTAFGESAEANDAGDVALGPYASATATTAGGYEPSLAVGYAVRAAGDHAIAVGTYAEATAESAIAIGADTFINANESIAIGESATATHPNSVAIGAWAATTSDRQIMLGTIDEVVTLPGGLEYHVETIQADTTVDTINPGADNVVIINATTNSVTVTLPTPTYGRVLHFKRIDTVNGNTVSIDPGVNQIDGQTGGISIVSMESLMLVSDGTNWFIL